MQIQLSVPELNTIAKAASMFMFFRQFLADKRPTSDLVDEVNRALALFEAIGSRALSSATPAETLELMVSFAAMCNRPAPVYS